jgi:hypothetical protein
VSFFFFFFFLCILFYCFCFASPTSNQVSFTKKINFMILKKFYFSQKIQKNLNIHYKNLKIPKFCSIFLSKKVTKFLAKYHCFQIASYHTSSTLVASKLILLFSEMLTFSQISFSKQFFLKKNKKEKRRFFKFFTEFFFQHGIFKVK